MVVVLTVVIALICVMLMGVVLIQKPKGGGLDATFGGTGNQLLGANRSTDFIEKVTWGLAIGLFLLCIAMSILLASTGGGTGLRTGFVLSFFGMM